MKRTLSCLGLVLVPALAGCSSANDGPSIAYEYCNVPPGTSPICGDVRDSGIPPVGPVERDASPAFGFARSALARDNPLLATPSALTNTVDDAQTFAFELQQKVGETPGNVFFSPFSVTTAMAMAWAGAKGTGPTPTASLRLDHPFLVMIRHVETGALLFTGRGSRP
jgi:hypothetical protein